jgi:hypothetical protein
MNEAAKRRWSTGQLLAIVLAAMVLSMMLALWGASVWLFPAELREPRLSSAEQVTLEAKLTTLRRAGDEAWLDSGEPYVEDPAARRLVFSERELNALIARNPELAGRVAVALHDELATARLLVPVDPGFPLLGGRNLRVSAGLAVSQTPAGPALELRGVSVMGVPLPAAWLGGLKDADLLERLGGLEASGIAALSVERGRLVIELRE